MTLRPSFSKRLIISPITFLATASGLIIERVLSVAMSHLHFMGFRASPGEPGMQIRAEDFNVENRHLQGKARQGQRFINRWPFAPPSTPRPTGARGAGNAMAATEIPPSLRR